MSTNIDELVVGLGELLHIFQYCRNRCKRLEDHEHVHMLDDMFSDLYDLRDFYKALQKERDAGGAGGLPPV